MSENAGEGFDLLLTEIGFGFWQAPIILSTLLVFGQLPLHLAGSPFLSAPMPFNCSADAALLNQHSTGDNGNSDDTYYSSLCLPDPVNLTTLTDVVLNDTVYFTGLPSCPYIEYDTSLFKSTINSDWHIVCEQDALRPLYQMMFNVGGLIGSLLSGSIGDRFGRKRALLIGCVGHLVAVILIVSVPSYIFILLMRVVIGIMMSVMLLPAWSLALEVTPSHHRSIVGMLMGLPFSFFVVCNAGFAYLIRTWQYLLLVGISPGIILFPLAMYIDESPSWLIQKGEKEKVLEILQRAVKQNTAKLTGKLDETLKELVEAATSSSGVRTTEGSSSKSLSESFQSLYVELSRYLTSPAMVTIILTAPVLWFMQSFLYLGISINANNFTSSGPFLYMALTGVMDALAILLITPLANRFGRKILISFGMFGGGSLFLLELLVPQDYSWMKWVCVMVGFLMVAGAYQVNFIYGPELFPTEYRSRGFGFLVFAGNTGFVCSPIVTEFLAKITWWATRVFFGCSGMLGSFAILFMPETRNKALPETLQDVEERRKRSRNKPKKDLRGQENQAVELQEDTQN